MEVSKELQKIIKIQESYYSKLRKIVKKFIVTSKLDKVNPDSDLMLCALLRLCSNIAVSTGLSLKEYARISDEMYLDELARLTIGVEMKEGAPPPESMSKEQAKAIENMEFLVESEKNIEHFKKIYNNNKDKYQKTAGTFEVLKEEVFNSSSLIQKPTLEQSNEFEKRKKTSKLN